MKHLIDDQIQDYLDGVLSKGDITAVERHLAKCLFCQREVEHYKNLYHSLSDETDFHLAPQFSALVVSKTKNESLGDVHSKLWQVFLALSGIIIAINTTLYYYDIKPFIEKVKNTNLSFDFMPQFIAPFKTFLTNFEGHQKLDNNLVIVVIVIMVFLALVDRFIFRSKNKFVTFV